MPNQIIELGDSHNNNKVVLVHSEHNVYILKPRSSNIEVAFKAFLLRLKQEGFKYLPECTDVIEEGDRWHKEMVVENKPAEDMEDVINYYRSCGCTLFITYLLGSNDLHDENIIASKNIPVLVDLETLLNGKIKIPESININGLHDTVYKSHLLPNWTYEHDRIVDCSGFNGNGITKKNRLYLNGRKTNIFDYIEDVVLGFQENYSLALHKKNLLKNIIHIFDGCETRILLRPTSVYDKIIHYIFNKDENEKKDFATKLLSRCYQNDIRRNRMEEMKLVCNAEIDAVLNDNIPLFYSYSNSKDLYYLEKIVAEQFLQKTALETVEERIEFLSTEDCNSQVKIIEQSINCAKPLEKYTKNRKSSTEKNTIDLVINLIENDYIPVLFSGWTKLDVDNSGTLFFTSVDKGLYDGVIGILLSYAAAFYKTGNLKYKKLLTYHYHKINNSLKNCKNYKINNRNGSVQTGVTGIVQCLLHISDLTEDDYFFNEAIFLLKNIQFGDANEKCEIDVDYLNGTLGLALCLPKIYIHNQEGKDLAIKIATEISKRLIVVDVDLTGMAHGMAGITVCLGALQHVLNHSNYNDTIKRLLLLENNYYYQNEHNWRDLRDLSDIHFMNGWCSGTPGIAMSRKRLMNYCNDEEIKNICKKDIFNAAIHLKSKYLCKRDSLCCGNSARLMACSNLGISNDYLYKTIENHVVNYDVRLFHPINTCNMEYGLMQGFSGVAYALSMYGDEKSGDMLL